MIEFPKLTIFFLFSIFFLVIFHLFNHCCKTVVDFVIILCAFAQRSNGRRTYLDLMKIDNHDCGQFPEMLIDDNLWNTCDIECNDQDYSDAYCCWNVCFWRERGALTAFTDENNNSVPVDVNWRGIVKTYMYDLGFETDNTSLWEPLVIETLERCDEQFGGPGGYNCDVIQFSLYAVLDCCSRKFLLKCPYWNNDHRPECAYTCEYIMSCTTKF